VAGRDAGYGLTTSQFGVLEVLHHLGPLHLGEHASTVAELVRHLEPDEQEQLRQLLKHLGKGIAGPTDST
jgi:hypothetical protein